MIVSLTGGLGNQMFQYAFGYSYAICNNERLSLDKFYLNLDKQRKLGLDRYKIRYNKTSVIYGFLYYAGMKIAKKAGALDKWKRVTGALVEEKPLVYQENDGKACFAIGNWINEAYFKQYRNELINEFSLKISLSEDQQKLLDTIKTEDSLAIHIRRGDYLKPENKAYDVVGQDYYDKALNYIKEKADNSHIYVFSDDIEWCRTRFSNISDITFVDDEISGSPYVDLELMRNCKFFIIANSTFSWWGAWLSERAGKIMIAPNKWYGTSAEDEFNVNVKEAILKDFVVID